MSVEAIELVLKYAEARGVARLVLMVLASHCNGKKGDFAAWPSLDVLEDETKLRQWSICRTLTHLETIGDIQRERSNGGRNKRTRYIITVSKKHSPTVGGIKPEGTGSMHAASLHALTDRGSQKKKGEGSSAPPGLPGFKETMALYHDLFFERFWAKPDIDGRDGKLLAGLIRAHGADELQGLLRFFFEHPPDWVEKKGKFTLYTFKGVYTELLAQSRNGRMQMGVL